jgi:hypothetical protein
MSKKLKSFPVGVVSAPTVVMDEDGEYRIGKVAVNENNDLCVRYYLPINRTERKHIKACKNDSTPQIVVYE